MPKVITEDLGKQFEKALCNRFACDYDGLYKYGEEVPNALQPQLQNLQELCPGEWRHTARNGAVNDFTNTAGGHLSAKTSKAKSGKVAPQLIGQAIPETFCERLNIPKMEVSVLKEFIQAHIKEILPKIYDNTFSCPVIYYNQAKKLVRHITPVSPIPWETMEFTWTRSADVWTNSSTLKANGNSILEIQFHTTRKNMAVRWCFDTVLDVFAEHFKVSIM
jgi:hypothetical protein